ncbi:MAG: PD-(D/E)XK nuclease family protein, partial [bacterium]|nr:PD-(D/E)XK nuclease family protein [bacterium]
QKFKFQIIDKIKAPKSVEAVFGTAVHAALKFMFSHDPIFPTLDEILANFAETWQASSVKVYPILDKNLSATYEESGKGLIKNFYKKNQPWNFSVVDTESKFEVLLPATDGKTHVLAGIIDRIDKLGDGEYEIIDYKTNRKLPSQAAVDANMQMSIYHMALTKRWPHIDPAKIKLSLYFLKHSEKLSSTRAAESLSTTTESVLNTIQEIERRTAENNFPPNPSPLCNYCPYKPMCPAWKHLYKKTDVPAPDEAMLQSALGEYFGIKSQENTNDKRIKELQAIIKTYMDANGVERVFDERGYYISKKLQQRFKYDLDKVKEILLESGLQEKWEALFEADEKKLKVVMDILPSPVRDKIANLKTLSKEFTVLTASTKPVKR